MGSCFPTITLVGVYFGALPFYSPLFFKSAAANPKIEFLIAGDELPTAALAPNLRFLPLTRESFEDLATRKLGRPMRLLSARKLCDYKPAYGRIFCDYLRRADFWGHIDLDVVWGNIPKFVEPFLDASNVISADGKRLSGVFTLYRNNHYFRELFRQIPDVYARMSAAECFDLDERDFDIVARTSCNSIALDTFYNRRNVSRPELDDFIANDFICRSVLKMSHLSEKTGRRLPAMWRSGELWNFLPTREPEKFRLLNSMLLHLTNAKVKFSVDFRNDLILPACI